MPRGFHAAGDVLVTKTSDGTDLNALWADYQAALAMWNARRDTVLNFLTYRTTELTEQVYQGGNLADFEPSTEFGVPVGARPGVTGALIGYDFQWFDIAGRFTWKFLNKATAPQVNAFANQVFEADNRLMFNEIMRTLFSNARRVASEENEGHTVYPFFAGAAGDKPVDYGTTVFADAHNHYVTTATFTSGAAGTAPAAMLSLMNLVGEHGYTPGNGYQVVIMANKTQANVIRLLRSEVNGGPAGALYDFVPASGTSPFLLPTNMQVVSGQQPPNSLNGMTVIGSYGDALIVEEAYIPAGYLVCFATGGPDSLTNPIGLREDANGSLRGLLLVKGREPDYPLIESYYTRGFGTGVRQRGAGAIMQITGGAYTPPAQYA